MYERHFMASEVHPNALSGLVPVSVPAFFGLDGDTKACKCVKINVDPACDDLPFGPDNLPLVGSAVSAAEELKWSYLLGIFDTPKKGVYVIRGC